MTTPWYDDPITITERIERGIPGLRELADERHIAGYIRRERLSDWCILGRFHLDSCGNFSRISEGAPADNPKGVRVPPVMPDSDVSKYSEQWTTVFGACLPYDGPCDRCYRDWSVDDLGSVEGYRVNGYDAPLVWRHKQCQHLARVEAAQTELSDIVRRSGIAGSTYLVPNEYYNSADAEPWMMLVTKRGRIKFGWRKRVISIDWKVSTLKSPASLFADEPVTQWENGIHAYGADKAVEYLRKLWEANGGAFAEQEAA